MRDRAMSLRGGGIVPASDMLARGTERARNGLYMHKAAQRWDCPVAWAQIRPPIQADAYPLVERTHSMPTPGLGATLGEPG